MNDDGLHSVDVGDEFLALPLDFLSCSIFEEDEAVAALHVDALDGDWIEESFLGVGRNHRFFEDIDDILRSVVRLKISKENGTKSS